MNKIIYIVLVVALGSQISFAQKPITPPKAPKSNTNTSFTITSRAKGRNTNIRRNIPDYRGHDYVDLGLPSGRKWATKNIGASSPYQPGAYFAWGEIEIKTYYTAENYTSPDKNTKHITGNPIYDVATAKWGGSWRIPTAEEFKELKEKCVWMWTTENGSSGFTITGLNGNSIFLPAGGIKIKEKTKSLNDVCQYWSADLHSSFDSPIDLGTGSSDPSSITIGAGYNKWIGLNIRPISN